MVQIDSGFGGTENVVLKNVLEIENPYKHKKDPLRKGPNKLINKVGPACAVKCQKGQQLWKMIVQKWLSEFVQLSSSCGPLIYVQQIGLLLAIVPL